MDRFTHLVLGAARQAEADAGLDIASEAERVGAAVAHRHRRPQVVPGLHRHAARARARPREPVLDPGDHPEPRRGLGVDGARHEAARSRPSAPPAPPRTWRSARALDAIRLGRADVMLAGGAEAPITQVGIAGFGAMRALSRRNDDPERASPAVRRRPRRLRDGRGRRDRSCSRSSSTRRRAARRSTPSCSATGVSSDANHITEPDPTGVNPARAMTMAFGDAGIDPARDRLHQRARHLDAARRRRARRA